MKAKLASLLFSSSVILAANTAAAEEVAFEGPAGTYVSSNEFVSALSGVCEFSEKNVRLNHRVYSREPATESETAALNAEVARVAETVGLSPDVGDTQISRMAIRAMLTARVMLFLEYDDAVAAGKIDCVSRQLIGFDFHPIQPEEARAIVDNFVGRTE